MSPRERRRSLELLAGDALRQFRIEPARVDLLTNKEHALFRVDGYPEGDGPPERFALRLYHPDAFHESSVRTELGWLEALTHHLGPVVPQPVMSPAGDGLVRVADGDAGRTGALFRWVAGRRRKRSLTPAAMAWVGRLVGQMHNVSTVFRSGTGADTQRWNWERVFGPPSPVGPGATDGFLTPEQREMFTRLSATLRMVMDGLGTAPEVWGIIHGDLHTSNYLFAGCQAKAIDFEDCGWGFYIYDLAVIMDEIHVAYPSRADELQRGLLDGYREVRPLTQEHEDLIDLFVGMRLAELVRWHALSVDATHRAAVPQLVDETVAHIQRLQHAGVLSAGT